MKKLNILITHVSYQAAAGSFIKMLRNSEKYNYYIVGTDSLKKGFSSGSMLVDKFYHLDLSTDDLRYIKFIRKICNKEKINVIISAEEEDLKLFKNYNISEALYQYIPELSIFSLFRDKHLANLSLKSKNILIPKYIMDFEDFNKSKSKKFILRERVSCCSRGIKIFTKNEINNNYIFFNDEHITQEFIDGNLYTVDVLCDKNGKVSLIIPRRVISVKDGTVFKCIIEDNDVLVKICKKIYSNYNIPGISNVQFIIKNEHAYFIELNPRAAATLIASSMASTNFIDLYISHFLYNEMLPEYDILMKKVRWNSVISRYYQETIMYRE